MDNLTKKALWIAGAVAVIWYFFIRKKTTTVAAAPATTTAAGYNPGPSGPVAPLGANGVGGYTLPAGASPSVTSQLTTAGIQTGGALIGQLGKSLFSTLGGSPDTPAGQDVTFGTPSGYDSSAPDPSNDPGYDGEISDSDWG